MQRGYDVGVIFLRDIRYVRLGTRDLDAAARFARDILGLEPAGCDSSARRIHKPTASSCRKALPMPITAIEVADWSGINFACPLAILDIALVPPTPAGAGFHVRASPHP